MSVISCTFYVQLLQLLALSEEGQKALKSHVNYLLSRVATDRVSSRIFCLGGKNSLESLTTPTFVGTLYWHVINLLRSRHCPLKVTLEFQSQMLILTK